MIEPLRTVAVLIANPALSSILSMTLAGSRALRVRPFESEVALSSYARLAPIDLVVLDFDGPALRADQVAAGLRADPGISERVQIVALSAARSLTMAERCDIDEIILKPMSPRYLVERVLARLAPGERAPRRTGFGRRDWSAFGDNVVPLFGPAPQP